MNTVSMTFFTDCCTQNFFFTGKSVCFHSIDNLFNSGKYMFQQWQIYVYPIYKHCFNQNMYSWTHQTLFCKFHMVCTFQPPKIWWQTSVQVWSTVLFFDILNSLKTYNFKQCRVYIYEKNLKKIILLFWKKLPIYWMKLYVCVCVCVCIYIYIYIYFNTFHNNAQITIIT